MRLHRLRLRDVKGVSERTVHFPDTGVVVIEGPNEVGKSTLLEALDRLLDTGCKASSKSQAVQAMQPVGVDAGPFVEAELTVGPYRVVFAKQWLRQTSTVLHILTPTAEQLTGDQAQTRMTQILQECLDRPLFDALRFTQAGGLTQIPLAESDVLAAALDGAAGADLHTDSGADLLGQVEAEHATYFTRTGRPTGAYRSMIGEVNQAQAVAVLAHGQVVEAHMMLTDRDRQESGLRRLREQTPVLSAEHEQAEREVAAAAEVVAAEQHALVAHEQTRTALGRAETDQRARADRVAAVRDRGESVSALDTEIAALDERAQDVQQTVAAAEATWARAEADHARAQQLLERTRHDVEHLTAVLDLQALTGRLEPARELVARRAQARAALDAHRVTPEHLREITAAQQTRDLARARVEAVATLLSVEGLAGERTVRIGEVSHAVAAGRDPVEQSVSHDTDVVVDGAVRVRVRPQADAAALAGRLERAEQTLAALLSDVGAPDVDAAVAAGHERQAVAEALRSLDTDLAVALSGDTLEELGLRCTRAREAVAATAEPTDPVTEGDLDRVRTALLVARDGVSSARSDLTTAEGQRDRASRGTAELGRHRAVLGARVTDARAELGSAQEQLAVSRSSVADAELEQDMAQAQQGVAVAAELVLAARQALDDADPVAVQQELRDAGAALQDHRAEVEGAGERLSRLKGQIEMAAGEGRMEAYELALQASEEATSALLSIDRRARAARHLHETLQRHRKQAHDTYVRPYREELERLGRQVYDDTFGVGVSRDLVITHRRLAGTSVPFDSLSGGAKEQLGILARLAVASLVDADQGVPVVIDDALGYTDPDRLQQIGRVLGAPAAGRQVIVLTCTPQRYAGLEGAATVRLTA